jgi:hypothetical protein
MSYEFQGISTQVYTDRGMKVTTQLCVLPKLKMCGKTSPWHGA